MDFDDIITHKYDQFGNLIINGPMVVIDNNGNVIYK
jgi:hypothetical protein